MNIDTLDAMNHMPWPIFDISETGGWAFIVFTLLALVVSIRAVARSRKRKPQAAEYMVCVLPLVSAATATFFALYGFYENWTNTIHSQTPDSLSRDMMFLAGAYRLAFAGGLVSGVLIVLLLVSQVFSPARIPESTLKEE